MTKTNRCPHSSQRTASPSSCSMCLGAEPSVSVRSVVTAPATNPLGPVTQMMERGRRRIRSAEY